MVGTVVGIRAIALVTPNGVDGVKGAGWKEGPARKVFVPRNVGPEIATLDDIEELWRRLEGALAEVEHVVVYLDSRWFSENLAHAARLTKEMTFLTCFCHEEGKRAALARYGFAKAPLLLCDCQGREGLRRTLQLFMKQGRLPEQKDFQDIR